MEQYTEDKIKNNILSWLDFAQISQKELAKQLEISAASINQMLKGTTPLPLGRFLQIAYVLKPDQSEINDIFALYLAEYNIPSGAITLNLATIKSANTRASIHALVDQLEESQLIAIETILKSMVK